MDELTSMPNLQNEIYHTLTEMLLVRQEMQKVTWPQRRDTFISSAIVILLVVLFSLFFLLTDQIWSFSIKKIIQIGSGF